MKKLPSKGDALVQQKEAERRARIQKLVAKKAGNVAETSANITTEKVIVKATPTPYAHLEKSIPDKMIPGYMPKAAENSMISVAERVKQFSAPSASIARSQK